MKDKMNKVTAVIMLGFIFVFSGLMLFGEKKKASESENRKLAELPEISISSLNDGSFSQKLGEYVTDHFPARERLTALDAKIEAQLSESIVNGVYVGNDMLLDIGTSEKGDMEKSAEEINKLQYSRNGYQKDRCI